MPTHSRGSSFQRPQDGKPATGHSGVKQQPREQRRLFGFVLMFTYLVSFKGKGNILIRSRKKNPLDLSGFLVNFPKWEANIFIAVLAEATTARLRAEGCSGAGQVRFPGSSYVTAP